MAAVNIRQARTHLSKLLARVSAGEEIIIAKHGRPIAKLVPFIGLTGVRRAGRLAGQIQIAADFDAPLPEDLQRAFEE